jgi:ribulose-phosphate 3-epimerase
MWRGAEAAQSGMTMTSLKNERKAHTPEGFALAAPKVRIAPSLLAADFAVLADEVRAIEAGGADLLHLDVMDGHFVPNLTIGPGLIGDLRKRSKLFFDAHLMIEEPARYAESFAKAGCDLITFHIEVTDQPGDVVAEIRRHGRAVGVSLNPTTPVSAIESIVTDVDLVLVMSVWPGFGGQEFITDVLSKVKELRSLLAADQRLEIDGGIDDDTIEQAVRAGADTFVAGSSIFGRPDPVAAMTQLRELAQRAAKEVSR